MLDLAMGSWLLLALLALALLCGYSLAMKRMIDVEPQDPVLLSAVVFVLVGVVAGLVWVLAGSCRHDLARLCDPRAAPLLAATILGYSLGAPLYYRALERLPVSRVAILHALAGVLTMLGAVALGVELFSTQRAVGAALLCVATVLVSTGPSSRRDAGPLGLVLLAAVFFAVAAVADQRLVHGLGLSPTGLLVLAYLLPGLLLIAVRLVCAPASRAALGQALSTPWVYTNALVIGVAYWAVYRAYAVGGPASGVMLILAAEVVGVVVGAALLLGERERLPLRLVSGVMAMLGVYLVR